MSRGKQKSTLRRTVLRQRHKIQELYRLGNPVKHIYKSLGMHKKMTYDTFLKYSRLCTRGVTVRSHSLQRAAFLSQLKQISDLYKEGYCAKDIQKLSGLEQSMSYLYFVNYLRDYTQDTSIKETLGQLPPNSTHCP